MEMQQLKYFVEIYKQKNLSKAAEACFISTQGISLSLQRLESELGEQLFQRTPKGIIPTKHAEFLLPRAKKILSAKDECLSYFSASSRYNQVCSISMSQGTIEEFAGSIIRVFQDTCPDIKLNIHECTDRVCENDVLNGETELGLIAGPVNTAVFSAKKLFSTRHALLVHTDHPLASKPTVQVDDLKGVPITFLEDETHTSTLFYSECRKAGFEPEIYLVAKHVLVTFYMAEIGLSAGIVTESLARRLNRPNTVAVPIDDNRFDWNVYLIKLRGNSISTAAKRFEQIVLEQQGLL